MTGFYIRDIFIWSFAFGWDLCEAMTNAFGKVIVITKSSG